MYATLSYWVANFIIEVPLLVCGSLVFASIVRAMVALRGPANWFYAGILLTSCVGYGQATVSAMLCPEGVAALILFCLFCCLEMIFSGFFVFIDDIPDAWSWMCSVVFTRWSTELLIYNEFNGFNGQQGQQILETFSFDEGNRLKYCMILLVYFVAWELLIIYGLTPAKSSLQVDSSAQQQQQRPSDRAQGVSVDTATSRSTFEIGADHRTKAPPPPHHQSPLFSSQTSSSSSFSSLWSLRGWVTQAAAPPSPSVSSPPPSLSQPLLTGIAPPEGEGLLLDQDKRAEFVFLDVGYSRRTSSSLSSLFSSSSSSGVRLLGGICGAVMPGDTCAVMGASGAG